MGNLWCRGVVGGGGGGVGGGGGFTCASSCLTPFASGTPAASGGSHEEIKRLGGRERGVMIRDFGGRGSVCAGFVCVGVSGVVLVGCFVVCGCAWGEGLHESSKGVYRKGEVERTGQKVF